MDHRIRWVPESQFQRKSMGMGAKIIAKEYTKLSGHKQGVYALQWWESQRLLVSAGGDGAVVLWDVMNEKAEERTLGKLFAQLPEVIFSLMLLEDGVILAGCLSGHLYRLQRGEVPRRVSLGAAIYFIQRWMDGRIAVGLGDGVLVLTDDMLRVQERVQVGRKSLRCALGFRGLVGGSDGKIWQLNSQGGVVNCWSANEPSVFCLMDTGDGGWVSGGRDALLWWFDSQGRVQEKVKAHMYTIHALVGYGDGMMVSGSMDKMVKVWDGRRAELLKVLDQQKFPGTGHSHAVNALCQLPLPKDSGSRRLLASAGDDKSIRIWELEIS